MSRIHFKISESEFACGRQIGSSTDDPEEVTCRACINDVENDEKLSTDIQEPKEKSKGRKDPETPSEKVKLAFWFISKFEDVGEARKALEAAAVALKAYGDA